MIVSAKKVIKPQISSGVGSLRSIDDRAWIIGKEAKVVVKVNPHPLSYNPQRKGTGLRFHECAFAYQYSNASKIAEAVLVFALGSALSTMKSISNETEFDAEAVLKVFIDDSDNVNLDYSKTKQFLLDSWRNFETIGAAREFINKSIDYRLAYSIIYNTLKNDFIRARLDGKRTSVGDNTIWFRIGSDKGSYNWYSTIMETLASGVFGAPAKSMSITIVGDDYLGRDEVFVRNASWGDFLTDDNLAKVLSSQEEALFWG